MCAGPRNSTKSQYENARKKWWVKFLNFAEWDKNFVNKPCFVDADGEPNGKVITSFFRFMWGQEVRVRVRPTSVLTGRVYKPSSVLTKATFTAEGLLISPIY